MQPISEEGSSPQPASPQPRPYQPIKHSTTTSGVRDESAQSIIVMEEFDDDDDETSPQQQRGWSRSEDHHHHYTGANDNAGSPLAPSYASSSLPGSHNLANNGKHPTDRKKGAMEFIRALHAQQQQQQAPAGSTTTSSNPSKPQQQSVADHAADQTHISVSTVNDAGGGASASDTDNNEDHHHDHHHMYNNNNVADRRGTNNNREVAALKAQSSAATSSHHNPQQQPQPASSYKQDVLDTSDADSDRQAFKDMVKSLAASPDQSEVQKEGSEEDQPPTKNSEILKMFLSSAQSTTSGGQRTTTTTKQQQPRSNATAQQQRSTTINNLTANNVYDSDSDSDGGGGVAFDGENHNNNISRETGGDDNTTMNFVEESHHFVGVAKSNVEPAYEPSYIHMAPPPPPQQGGGKGGLNSSRPASRAASSSNLLRRGSGTETNPHAAVLERMKQKDLELQIKKENRARAAQEEADRECTFQPATRASGSSTFHPAHSSDNFEANGPQYEKETEAFASHRTAAIAHRRRLAERRQQQRFEEEKAMDLQLRNNTPKGEALYQQDPNVTNNNNNAGHSSYSHQMAASKIHHTSSGRSLSPRSTGSSRPHSPTNNNNHQQQPPRVVGGSPTSAISGRTYVFGTPQNRRGNQSGVPRSETSTVDMINMTFQPSIGPRSRNVYVNGARGVEGTLDTFTRLYSRSMGYQLSNPTYRETLKREEEARAAYRRVNLNETNAITVLEEGSPERRFLSKHLLDVLPIPLSLELDGLRNHFHLMRDKDIAGTSASCTSTRQRTSTTVMGGERSQILPPHFMVPFLCNSLGCNAVSGIELIDTHGLGLNPAKGTTTLPVASNNTHLRNRYSKKQLGGGGEENGEEDAVGAVLGTLCDANSYIPAPTPAPQGGPSTSTPRRSQSAGGGGRQVPAVRTEASLSEFLQRQKSLIESKRRKTEELTKKLAPSGKPTLSKGTISISDRQQRSASARAAATPARAVSSTTPGGRQQRELSPRQKREAELSKPRPTPTKHYDTNLTFKPVISPFATVSIEGRTTDRMFEEGQRRTDRLEKLREASWKREQSQGATFKPKTNVGDATSRYGNVQSLLHPSNVKNNVYSSYLNKRKLVREKLHEVQTVEAEEEDLRECTFRPAINPQPSYITKMAQNYSLLKKY